MSAMGCLRQQQVCLCIRLRLRWSAVSRGFTITAVVKFWITNDFSEPGGLPVNTQPLLLDTTTSLLDITCVGPTDL